MTAETAGAPDLDDSPASIPADAAPVAPPASPALPAPKRAGGVKPVTAQKRRRGPKPRHVPQRTCIVLRQTGDKRALVRLVRTPEGRVEVDPGGKRNGRGAYLTADRAVWERALGSNTLARALNIEAIGADDLAALRAHAETLPADPALAAQFPALQGVQSARSATKGSRISRVAAEVAATPDES